MYAKNSRESKNEIRSGVFYGPLQISIQTHEKDIKKRNEKKNIRTSWNWFSNVKTMNFYYKTNLCNEFKGIQR